VVCLGVPKELYEVLEEAARERGVAVRTLIRQILAQMYGVGKKRRRRGGGRRPVVKKRVLETFGERPWLAAALKPAAVVLGVGWDTMRYIFAKSEDYVFGVHVQVYEALKRDLAAWLCKRSREWKSGNMTISITSIYKRVEATQYAHLNNIVAMALKELGAVRDRKKRYTLKNGSTCQHPHCYGDLRVLRLLHTAYRQPSEETLKTLWELSIRCVDGEP